MAEFSDPVELDTVTMSKAGRDNAVDNLSRACNIISYVAGYYEEIPAGELDDVIQWLEEVTMALERLT